MRSDYSLLKGSNIISGFIYSTKLNCASAEGLIEYIEPHFKSVSFDKKDVSIKLKELISSFSEIESRHLETRVLTRLIAKDLSLVSKQINDWKNTDIIKNIDEDFKRYISLLHQFKIKLPDTTLKIVNTFPKPYEKMDIWAMTYDTYDQEEFGIPRGVQFMEKYLMPNVSSFILSHELVHIAIGTKKTHYLARGLEDGLADFASLVLTDKRIRHDIAENILFNMKFPFPQEQEWAIYRDAFRQVFLLYALYGTDGIFQIIANGQKKGRKHIKEIEDMCLNGKYQQIDVKNGPLDNKILEIYYRYVGYPYNLVVSPLAYFLAKKISVGSSIKGILKEYNISYLQGKKAIQELQDRVYLILIDGDTIVSDDTKMYIKNSLLRYEIKRCSI